MPQVNVQVDCPVFDSFRVQQVAGMFDVPLAQRARERFALEIPELSDGWQIGLIVGPSGSGKTTIAREIFGCGLYRRQSWPRDRAVIDGLGDLPIKTITGLFTAVGFSSPPSWIKPYQVLSNGEQFRCDLARSLAGGATAGLPRAQSSRLPSSAEPPRAQTPLDKPGSDRKAVVAPSCCPIRPGGNDAAPQCEDVAANEDTAVLGREKGGGKLVVFDEFTSVVDRNVARVVSAAIARGIRRGQIACRFVAVTCHYDVTEWLQPDWVIDMATSTFQRRCLPRPAIELEIFRCRRSAWEMFKRHHYLSGSLSAAARCFLALWEGNPVAFCATLSLLGHKNRRRISRIVTLPDYQGVGIGMAVAEAVAEYHRRQGHRLNVTASHPALIAHCRRSSRWRAVSVKKTGSHGSERFIKGYRGSAGRAVVSFEYVGTHEEGLEIRN